MGHIDSELNHNLFNDVFNNLLKKYHNEDFVIDFLMRYAEIAKTQDEHQKERFLSTEDERVKFFLQQLDYKSIMMELKKKLLSKNLSEAISKQEKPKGRVRIVSKEPQEPKGRITIRRYGHITPKGMTIYEKPKSRIKMISETIYFNKPTTGRRR